MYISNLIRKFSVVLTGLPSTRHSGYSQVTFKVGQSNLLRVLGYIELGIVFVGLCKCIMQYAWVKQQNISQVLKRVSQVLNIDFSHVIMQVSTFPIYLFNHELFLCIFMCVESADKFSNFEDRCLRYRGQLCKKSNFPSPICGMKV